MQALHDAVRERETRTLEIMRQLQQRGGATPRSARDRCRSTLPASNATLGSDTALVEYTSLDGELLAFVVTDESIEVVRGLADEKSVAEALGQFRFQVGSLRYGSARMRSHLASLDGRARRHLRSALRPSAPARRAASRRAPPRRRAAPRAPLRPLPRARRRRGLRRRAARGLLRAERGRAQLLPRATRAPASSARSCSVSPTSRRRACATR